MEKNEQDEVIVDNVEESNEEVAEITEETPKQEKPKRTPQEEYDYHSGKAKRLAKKLGLDSDKAEPVKETSSKPSEMDMGTIAYLNSLVGLKGKDELALAREYIANGKDALSLSENKFFMQDLQTLRDARASTDAIPKGKNRSGQTGITDIDLAVAKYKETGEFPADFETRNKVVDAITKEEKGALFT